MSIQQELTFAICPTYKVCCLASLSPFHSIVLRPVIELTWQSGSLCTRYGDVRAAVVDATSWFAPIHVFDTRRNVYSRAPLRIHVYSRDSIYSLISRYIIDVVYIRMHRFFMQPRRLNYITDQCLLRSVLYPYRENVILLFLELNVFAELYKSDDGCDGNNTRAGTSKACRRICIPLVGWICWKQQRPTPPPPPDILNINFSPPFYWWALSVMHGSGLDASRREHSESAGGVKGRTKEDWRRWEECTCVINSQQPSIELEKKNPKRRRRGKERI